MENMEISDGKQIMLDYPNYVDEIPERKMNIENPETDDNFISELHLDLILANLDSDGSGEKSTYEYGSHNSTNFTSRNGDDSENDTGYQIPITDPVFLAPDEGTPAAEALAGL